MRVGLGYDVHKLTEGRDLILGGVKIPYEKGLLGHSDADVLLHAIMDALLGAAALGDIGKHFPDTDERYRGISIAQRPKMLPYIEQMRENIAEVLGLEKEQINIKATTEEGLGFTGSGEGISSQAICAIESMRTMSYQVFAEESAGGCQGCGGCRKTSEGTER